jgi:hypothetical protein
MNLLLDWKFPVNNDFVRNVRFYGRLDKLERLLKVTTDGQERLLMSNLIKQEDFVSIDAAIRFGCRANILHMIGLAMEHNCESMIRYLEIPIRISGYDNKQRIVDLVVERAKTFGFVIPVLNLFQLLPFFPNVKRQRWSKGFASESLIDHYHKTCTPSQFQHWIATALGKEGEKHFV